MALNLKEIRQFENLELLAKELVEGFITGLHRSPYHGFSVEFAEHKLYNFGESTRNIDWKVYARTDRLYTKQYEEETNLRCSILLDVSSSMYYPQPGRDKIRFSVYAAAALSYLMIKQRDAVGLVPFSDQIQEQTQQRSTRTHFNAIMKSLDTWVNRDIPEKNQSNIAETIHLIADQIHKRSLVVIFTDMFQQVDSVQSIFEALQHLKHNKHEVLLFHTSDKKTEKDFEFEDRPYKFIDMETNQSVTLNPSAVKSEYTKQMEKFYEEIKLGCGKLKIDLVEVDTNDPFGKILGASPIKRKRLS